MAKSAKNKKKVVYDITPTVRDVSQASSSLYGHIVPPEWSHVILTKSGRPDYTTINLLGYIWGWYIWKREDDEDNQQILIRKRFREDKVSLTYRGLQNHLNITERQARRALHKLRDMKLITIEYRTIRNSAGYKISDIMFIEPVVDNILSLTEKGREIINTKKGIKHWDNMYDMSQIDIAVWHEGNTDVSLHNTLIHNTQIHKEEKKYLKNTSFLSVPCAGGSPNAVQNSSAIQNSKPCVGNSSAIKSSYCCSDKSSSISSTTHSPTLHPVAVSKETAKEKEGDEKNRQKIQDIASGLKKQLLQSAQQKLKEGVNKKKKLTPGVLFAYLRILATEHNGIVVTGQSPAMKNALKGFIRDISNLEDMTNELIYEFLEWCYANWAMIKQELYKKRVYVANQPNFFWDIYRYWIDIFFLRAELIEKEQKNKKNLKNVLAVI